ncbi:site-specific integrase [Paenibacillus sp. KQZ6P-2]|uniref:Site-specific integrase n=1 Tax=Paenibacillus mangrovi TaxID=2931978 RepID=A0A9X2B5Q3_9BACL|nr:tyrosine-type recombinase/integrase [Paenibacillus mangrovi]MCJ8015255.1 site-specific integrase [Paenibacillus mangrovi]
MANYKKHKTGWEYRLKYKDPFTKKTREKSERGYRTKPEAEMAAADFLKKVKQGYGMDEDVSLVNYLDMWMTEYKKGTIRKNTFELHQNNIKNHIAPYFQNLMLRELNPEMYQKFLNHLTSKGYSKRTVEIVHGTMHNAMEKAVNLYKLEKNPCIGVEIKGEKKNNEIQFIESKDIPNFLQAAHQYGYIYWIFFKVLIETGIRKGEAAALKWTDIDFKNQTIKIDETLDFTASESKELFGDPKTFRSNRTIRISQSLVNDLKYHANWQNQNKLNLKDLYKHDLNLVLCRNDGNFMPKSSLFNSFERICMRAKLPKLPIHSLRHTCAVLLLESGADMKYVQEQLGHGSIQITSDVYAHISKKIEEQNIARFEEYTKNILNQNLNYGGRSGGTTQFND